ncbi:hypothetical protein ACEN2J_17755 [Pseudorhodobacter sp. W20_MBD10_FR17]|uniref:hypothetical protein n=1 Tax=Pseudorhodobacter sp. W20_MBD10_FR17 TaxID=3240266 RepID=UPI003F9E97A9
MKTQTSQPPSESPQPHDPVPKSPPLETPQPTDPMYSPPSPEVPNPDFLPEDPQIHDD